MHKPLYTRRGDTASTLVRVTPWSRRECERIAHLNERGNELAEFVSIRVNR